MLILIRPQKKKLAIFLTLFASFATIAMAQTLYHDRQYTTIGFGNYDLCEQRTLIDIAQKHGLGFELGHGDEMPNIRVTGKKQVIAQVRQELEQRYPPATAENGYATAQRTQHCHLTNVKNNVPNINAKLVPYIPNDVDYVSYSPSEDKAVYCYYYFPLDIPTDNNRIGSQCSFIQMTKDAYGKDEFESYDISDMERANLHKWWEFSRQQPSAYYGAYSYVTKWQNSPTHYFGFNLMTPYDGNRWGAYGEY